MLMLYTARDATPKSSSFPGARFGALIKSLKIQIE